MSEANNTFCFCHLLVWSCYRGKQLLKAGNNTVWKWDALLKLSNQQHKPDRKRAEHEESVQGSCCALYCPALKVFGPPLTSHNPPGSSITQRSDWCCKSRADPGSVSGGDCVRSPQALTEISWNWDPPVFSSLYQKGVEWRSGLLIKQAHTYDEWNHLKIENTRAIVNYREKQRYKAFGCSKRYLKQQRTPKWNLLSLTSLETCTMNCALYSKQGQLTIELQL